MAFLKKKKYIYDWLITWHVCLGMKTLMTCVYTFRCLLRDVYDKIWLVQI